MAWEELPGCGLKSWAPAVFWRKTDQTPLRLDIHETSKPHASDVPWFRTQLDAPKPDRWLAPTCRAMYLRGL